jgi:hypothetical protein
VKKTKKKDEAVIPEVLVGESGPTQAGYHQMEAFLRCPFEYQLKAVRQVRPPVSETPEPLAVGALFHAGRARWFSKRFATCSSTWQSIADAMTEEAQKMSLPVSREAERLAMTLMNQYVEHYSTRVKPNPLAAEYLVGPAAVDGRDPFAMRTARLDDVSRYPEAGNKLCIGEAKTTSKDVADCVNQYTLHGQPMLQVLLWKHSPQGEKMHGPVAGVMLDVAVKPTKTQKAKFSRMFLPVTDHALEWYVRSLRGYLRAMAGVEWNTEVPRNVTACTRPGAWGRAVCDFRDLCAHGRAAAGKYVTADGKSLAVWKPSKGKETPPWL